VAAQKTMHLYLYIRISIYYLYTDVFPKPFRESGILAPNSLATQAPFSPLP